MSHVIKIIWLKYIFRNDFANDFANYFVVFPLIEVEKFEDNSVEYKLILLSREVFLYLMSQK